MSMRLEDLYRLLVDRAKATGHKQTADLPGGARLGVAVEANQTTLVLSRIDKKLGDVEISTFRKHCRVPQDAIRFPSGGEQATRAEEDHTRYYIVYRWIVPIVETVTKE